MMVVKAGGKSSSLLLLLSLLSLSSLSPSSSLLLLLFSIQSNQKCSIMSASSDLENVICIGGTPGNTNSIYYSNDKGKTWSKSTVDKNQWIGIASNSDFSNIVTVVKLSGKYSYGSTDGGVTFNVLADNEKQHWSCMASSRDLEVSSSSSLSSLLLLLSSSSLSISSLLLSSSSLSLPSSSGYDTYGR